MWGETPLTEAMSLCWTPLPYFFLNIQLCSGERSENAQNYTGFLEITPQILSSQLKILHVFSTDATKLGVVPLKQIKFEFNPPKIHCSYTEKEDHIFDIMWFNEKVCASWLLPSQGLYSSK